MSLPPITPRDTTIGIRDTASISTPQIQPKIIQKQLQTQDKSPVDYSNIPVSSTVNTSHKPFELSDSQIDAIINKVLNPPNGLKNPPQNTPFQNDIHGVLKSKGHPAPRAFG